MAIKFLDSAGLTYFINKIVYGITSPKFSTGSTYTVGDFVIYTGKLYRCTTAVTVAGAWSASKWVQTTVSGELKSLRDVYTATYTVAGWTVSGDGTYWTQSKSVTGMTSTKQLSAPLRKNTGVKATDAALAKAHTIINNGTITSNSGSVSIKVWEKPAVDIDIYWSGKETNV